VCNVEKAVTPSDPLLLQDATRGYGFNVKSLEVSVNIPLALRSTCQTCLCWVSRKRQAHHISRTPRFTYIGNIKKWKKYLRILPQHFFCKLSACEI